jgi:alpha/beta superfamily hydrolase
MRNPVVDALFRALHDAGAAVSRFDFRGVGTSGGEHDGGDAERLDAAAALELVAPLAGEGPVLLCGYSFGGLVALDVSLPVLSGWVAVAPPLGTGRRVAAADHRPKLLVVGTHDQFVPAERCRQQTADWPATTVAEVEMADHFFGGRTAFVADLAASFLGTLR